MRARGLVGVAAALGLLAWSRAPAAADAPIEVRADLSPDPVALDELAALTLVVESSGFSLPRVEPGFLLENLEGAGGPSRSQSTSWVNGQSTSRLELVWRLRPVALGRARVHSFRVEIGEGIRSLPELAVEVVERAPPGRAPRAGRAPADPFSRLFEDDPFGIFPRRRRDEPLAQPKLALRSLVAPTEAYVGQQVVWTLALDTQTDISGFRPRALPELAGFWARDIELPERPRPEWVEVDGERYGRVAMLARALFPLRAGELPIARVTADVMARMADPTWIGGLHGDRPLELSARPVTVDVRPLPPAPRGFTGIVGTAELTSDVEPPRLAAGQAATLVVRATTSGNPQGVAPPALALPDGLRSFAPATSSDERMAGGRLETAVEWRYVVLADRAGEYELPPVEWVYFDPATRRYERAATAPLRLSVAAAAVAAASAPPAVEEPAGPRAAPAVAPSLASAGKWLLAIVAATLAGGLAWRRLRAPTALRELLRALDVAAGLPAPREAAKAIDAAWRALLVERYALGRGTPLAQWPDALARAGWKPALAAELQQLFEEIHLLEFAPELADAEALREDVDRRSRDLARRLR